MPQSDWVVVWLAVGAISLALTALLQIGAIVALIKVVMAAQKTLHGVQAQVAPLINRGQVLLTSAGTVVDKAHGVVDQAHAVVLNAATQVKRVESAVTAAADGITDFRHGVRNVTSRATDAVSNVRSFWSMLRGRGRGGLHRTPPPPYDTDEFSESENG